MFVDIGNNGQYSQIFLEPYMLGTMISAVGLVLFCLSFRIPRGRMEKAIQYIGGKTFMVYLLHVLVQRCLLMRGLDEIVLATVKNEIGAAVICILVCFMVSMLLAYILDIIKKGCFNVICESSRSKPMSETN